MASVAEVVEGASKVRKRAAGTAKAASEELLLMLSGSDEVAIAHAAARLVSATSALAQAAEAMDEAARQAAQVAVLASA